MAVVRKQAPNCSLAMYRPRTHFGPPRRHFLPVEAVNGNCHSSAPAVCDGTKTLQTEGAQNSRSFLLMDSAGPGENDNPQRKVPQHAGTKRKPRPEGHKTRESVRKRRCDEDRGLPLNQCPLAEVNTSRRFMVFFVKRPALSGSVFRCCRRSLAGVLCGVLLSYAQMFTK